ncbi:MAG: glutamate-cysteine ligase family protein [Pseudolabrys sp.]
MPLADLDRHRQERSGMLPWAFDDGMGFERYVDYALDVPMYFVKRGATNISTSRAKSFKDFFGRHSSTPCRASGRPFPTGPIT